jgi:F-type H+-transporting ATPase subunit b
MNKRFCLILLVLVVFGFASVAIAFEAPKAAGLKVKTEAVQTPAPAEVESEKPLTKTEEPPVVEKAPAKEAPAKEAPAKESVLEKSIIHDDQLEEAVQGDAHAEAAGEHHGPVFEPIKFGIGIFNFALFIFLIVKFGGKGIAGYYKTRAQTQMEAVREAEQILSETRAIFTEIIERKGNLEQETRKLIEDARRRAEQQAVEIVEAATTKAQNMIADGKRMIDTELEMAIARLRSDLVDHAISVAETGIAQKLNEDGQKALVENFMSNMEDVH